jgi:hypothetical protein
LDRLLDLKRIELAQIEEHQAYKISKLLAQKTFFSQAFSRVRTRAVSRAPRDSQRWDRISVRFKRFHMRSSSIVGFSSFIKPVSLLESWTRSQRVASTEITTEKFAFITKWLLLSPGKHS